MPNRKLNIEKTRLIPATRIAKEPNTSGDIDRTRIIFVAKATKTCIALFDTRCTIEREDELLNKLNIVIFVICINVNQTKNIFSQYLHNH